MKSSKFVKQHQELQFAAEYSEPSNVAPAVTNLAAACFHLEADVSSTAIVSRTAEMRKRSDFAVLLETIQTRESSSSCGYCWQR